MTRHAIHLVLLISIFNSGTKTALGSGRDESPATSESSQLNSAVATVTTDFAEWADYPLSKAKFGVYNSGLVQLPHYDRDINLFNEVKPRSLRIDLWWGGGPWSVQPISGTPEDVQYHFHETDHIAALLNAHDIQPFWSYCYVPPPLQPRKGDWRRMTTNTALWGKILGAFAAHAKEGGASTKIGYHEIYNEPDNRDFFQSSRDDYFALYREGSRAIRRADPEAVIGGPALAFSPAWVRPFLDLVVRDKLPLDFFSFHFYPGCWQTNSVRDVVRLMRRDLANCPQLAMTEMFLDEFNSLPIDYPKGGKQDRYGAASAMLQDYEWFLSQPDLAQVNWAQFQDTGGGNWSGMISEDGHRKALFNAAAIYARMPIDRKNISFQNAEGVNGMASADNHRTSLLIWNRSSADRTVKAILKHAPFTQGDLSVYRIDGGHSSWGDKPESENLIPVEMKHIFSPDKFEWSGSIPRDGTLYFELNNSRRQTNSMLPVSADIIRVLHYYPDRFSAAYTDFDQKEWIARLGMANESNGEAVLGVMARNLPSSFRVHVETHGKPSELDVNSSLRLRIDYKAGTNYARSALYYGRTARFPALYNTRRTTAVPWGTKRPADRVIEVSDFSDFIISPGKDAPEMRNGEGIITFWMQNTGKNTQTKMRLLQSAP
jgi:xylan 1,4-beta-xylosidase